MSNRDVVEQWLFEYACRHHLSSVLTEIANKCPSTWSHDNCSIPPVYVLLSLLKYLVENSVQEKYEMVISELNRLYDVSDDVVPFKVYARLTVALKIVVLFRMLRSNDPLVLPRLNSYFPRTGFKHPKADAQTAARLSVSQLQFRTIFLRLIADADRRREYLAARYEVEYGAEFTARTVDLVRQFVSAVDKSLPHCAIDKLLEPNIDTELVELLTEAHSPEVEMLLDAVHGKDCLAAGDISSLLHCLQPDGDSLPASLTTAFCRELLTISEENQTADDTQSLHQNITSSHESVKCRINWSRSVDKVLPTRDKNLPSVSRSPERNSTPAQSNSHSTSLNYLSSSGHMPPAKKLRISDADMFCTDPGANSGGSPRRKTPIGRDRFYGKGKLINDKTFTITSRNTVVTKTSNAGTRQTKCNTGTDLLTTIAETPVKTVVTQTYKLTVPTGSAGSTSKVIEEKHVAKGPSDFGIGRNSSKGKSPGRDRVTENGLNPTEIVVTDSQGSHDDADEMEADATFCGANGAAQVETVSSSVVDDNLPILEDVELVSCPEENEELRPSATVTDTADLSFHSCCSPSLDISFSMASTASDEYVMPAGVTPLTAGINLHNLVGTPKDSAKKHLSRSNYHPLAATARANDRFSTDTAFHTPQPCKSRIPSTASLLSHASLPPNVRFATPAVADRPSRLSPPAARTEPFQPCSPTATRHVRFSPAASDSTTHVSDSDSQSQLDSESVLIVPSSYSFDQYDTVYAEDSQRRRKLLLPPIEQHLRDPSVAFPCVIQLHLDESKGTFVKDGRSVNIYN